MIAVSLGLIAALSWGLSDFLGGLQTRTVRLAVVLAVSMTSGLATIVAVLLVAHRQLPDDGRLWCAVAAGPASVIALGLLYQAMARGPIIVVAPVAAVGAVIPVLWGMATGDGLGLAQAAGILLALSGATLASWEAGPAETEGSLPAAAASAAVGAALAIGLFLVLVGRASQVDALWAAGIMRGSAWVVAMVLLVTAGSRGVRDMTTLPRRTFGLLALVGVTDIVAETSYALATTHVQVGVAAVIASMYPVVTVALAAVVLGERVHGRRGVGVVLALAGVAALTGVV